MRKKKNLHQNSLENNLKNNNNLVCQIRSFLKHFCKLKLTMFYATEFKFIRDLKRTFVDA